MEHNLASVHEAIAAEVGDRECIVSARKRLTWAEVTDRTRRLGSYLRSRGLGCHTERSELEGWESGQDHVGLYLLNGNEYLEGMLGAFKARAVPFNVNYRYVAEELVYLLRDARARGLVYHAAFAPQVAEVRGELPDLEVLVQVEDGSGNSLLDGAVDYEDALASASPDEPEDLSPDDLYILYTGGTTGMPKGVLWRQADIYTAAMGGSDAPLSEIASNAKAGGARVLPAPPFMHGAAHWVAFNTFNSGGTIVIQSDVERLDAHDIWSTVEREKASALLIVGDAFGRPLADALKDDDHDLSSLAMVITGGAPLNATIKEELTQVLENTLIVDVVGSSETGSQGTHVSSRSGGVSTGQFQPGPNTTALHEDLSHLLEPGTGEVGWLAQTGPVPLGYYGDEAKTKATFPVVDGVRYSVPGDRVRLLTDGAIELLGRDSVTINSGGEKIFAEEVEAALRHHPDVFDVVVAGRPSDRWGQEVVAVVQPRDGATLEPEALSETAAEHIARYKLPKAYVFADEIVRSPSGKADYRWAKEQATAAG